MWFRKKMTEEEIKKEAEQPAEEPKAAEEQPAEPATETEEKAEETPADEKPVEEQSAAEEKPSEEKPAEVDWKLQYARLLADFDNYKKRAARDRDDTYRYVESQVLKDLLPSVDNLAMALDKAENKDDPFVKGVKLVYDGILAMLKNHGAEPFDSVGQPLDTDKMEAIAQLPSPDVEEGKVSVESKKGWFLKGKVLRAAQVVVSSGKPEETK
ncbi:MAG: nucleotide exchange factor GrpE [Kiritimatiellia bacterium]